MSKILIFAFLLPIFVSSVGTPSKMDQLLEINVEISILQKQLGALEKKVNSDYHKEMEEELYSQRNMRSYEWASFSQHLESAETFEENARRDEKLIDGIKARLTALAEQIDRLISN